MNVEQIGRTVFWLIPEGGRVVLYLLIVLSLLAAARQGYRRLRAWRRGRSGPDGAVRGWSRMLTTFREARNRMRRDTYAGRMHMLVFWGFLALALGSAILAVDHDARLGFLHGGVYLGYSLVMDAAGVALLAGLLLALRRRHVRRLPRLERSPPIVLFLWLLLSVGVTGFLVEGARIAATMPAHEVWSPVGFGLAALFRSTDVAAGRWQSVYLVTYALHVALIVAFFGTACVLFTRHAIFASAHLLLPSPPQWVPATEDGAVSRAATGNVSDLAWRQLLAADACTACGRCHDACPALASGTPLDPRQVVRKVRQAIDVAASGADCSLTAMFAPDELWSCTTCGACAHECPARISPLGLIEQTRALLTDRGEVPAKAAQALENILYRGDPWGNARTRRLEWAGSRRIPVVADDDSRVELLYWVGCAGAFDPQGQEVARAVVSLLEKAEVSYAVLGAGERCCGEPARRLGEEGLFEKVARENVAAFRRHGVRRIVTACPHCLNTFKREYRELGATFEVVHHTQLLNELVAAGNLRPSREFRRRLTFHDPCYLGRHNGESRAPRALLEALPGVVVSEMPRHGDRSFCCGGGGGQAWVTVPVGRRIDEMRITEAVATGAEVLATACPFCRLMLSAAATTAGDGSGFVVRDVAELLDENT